MDEREKKNPVSEDAVVEDPNAQTDATDSAATLSKLATKKKKKRRWWVVLLIVLAVLLLVCLLLIQCAWWWLHRTIDDNVQKAPEYSNRDVAAKPEEDIVQDIVDSVPEELPPEEIDKIEQAVSNVQNIALFGVDQESGSVGRSDTMIMLSATPHDGRAKSFASLMNMLDPTAIANPEYYTRDDIKGLCVRRFKKDVKDQVSARFPHVRVTRLAQGIPLGAEVKYMDRETLRQSLRYRQSL